MNQEAFINELDQPEAGEPEIEITVSRHFADWLAGQGVSLAFTNPPLKLFLIGLKADGEISIFERTFPRCMGLACEGEALYISTRYHIWRLQNALPPGRESEGGYDRHYIPRKVYTTGALGTHDLAVDRQGRIIFVNTRFGCLAAASERYSFVPLWRPAFLSDLKPGDRCHLNGLAMQEGLPAYVTCVSRTDSFDSWREHRRDGGAVIDLKTGESILAGLSMPHSPRIYRNQLWLANSGSGHLGRVDLNQGRFEPLAFAPGFLRGLSFSGDYAIIGSSKPRRGDAYSGLKLDDTLREKGLEPRLGLFIIDLRSGKIAHWLFIQSSFTREIYDVVVLPGVRRPTALGIIGDEIQKTVWFNPRWSEQSGNYLVTSK